MIYSLIIFLPTFICLFSTLAHLKLTSRTEAHWELFFMGLATFFFLLSDACLVDGRASELELTHVSFIGLLAAPCVIPLAIMYIRKLRYPDKTGHSTGLLWIVAPAVLFTASLVMYLIIGEQNVLSFLRDIRSRGKEALVNYRGTTELTYFMISEVVFRIVLAVEIIVIIVYITGWAIRDRLTPWAIKDFFSNGKSLKIASIQTFFILPILVVVIIKLFNIDFHQHKEISVILSLILSVFLSGLFFTALFGSRKDITRKRMRYAMMYNYNPDNKGEVVEEMMNFLLDEAETEALERVQEKIGKNLHIEEFKSEEASQERSEVASKIFEAVSDTWDEDDMLGRFQRLMRDEMLFLKPGLSLDDVAERMNTNKFYISKMVNNTFNLGFPEVVNILRVDYAEQYIIQHPEAKQIEIAEKCGFISASTFNTVFKKVTGVTPKMWIAAREKAE